MPEQPWGNVAHYGAEIIVIAGEDYTEIRRPDMDHPLLLKPGERVRFRVTTDVTSHGYIEGVGWSE